MAKTRNTVSSGHPSSTMAGYRAFESGGNAIDAGVAAGIAINVVLPESTSFGGVAPIVLHSAATHKSFAISGLGPWPAATDISSFDKDGLGRISPGVENVLVPAAAGSWLTTLRDFGTLTFEEAARTALELARDGFRLHESGANHLNWMTNKMRGWPSTAAVFAPGGKPVRTGERLVQPALARTFERLVEVERAASGRGREGALNACLDYYYRGPIAQEIVAFIQDNGGFLTLHDMAEFKLDAEPPMVGHFGRFDVVTGGPWSQAPILIQALQMLSDDDLELAGHNSADYIHTVAEVLNLAFSDRDAFYGDPDFEDVPIEGLLSAAYAQTRRTQVDPTRASASMPAAGDPWPFEGRVVPDDYSYRPPVPGGTSEGRDTSSVCAVDQAGNMFAATPSDTLLMSPVIPELGFTPSGRGVQGWLDHRHPASVAPGKRPTITPSPAIAFRDGEPWMPFSATGSDAQCQSMLQIFLNMTVFNMDLQAAVKAPRFVTRNFPNSFWPHGYDAGKLQLEKDIGTGVANSLERLGHRIEWLDRFDLSTGGVVAITADIGKPSITESNDPRREAYRRPGLLRRLRQRIGRFL